MTADVAAWPQAVGGVAAARTQAANRFARRGHSTNAGSVTPIATTGRRERPHLHKVYDPRYWTSDLTDTAAGDVVDTVLAQAPPDCRLRGRGGMLPFEEEPQPRDLVPA